MARRADRQYHSRPTRGTGALKTAATCASYEFEMFIAASNLLILLRKSSDTPEVVALRNIALESTLIHARNLRDFFSPNGRDNDVLARDFVTPLPRIAMPYLRRGATGRRIDKLLAHPSYDRSRLSKQWPIGTLRNELSQAWKLFLDRVARDAPKLRRFFR
jgi:hypothetical protein